MTEFIILVLNIKLEVKIISFEENVFFKITLLNFAPQNYKFSHFNHTYSPKRNPTKAKPTKTIVRSNTQHWDKNSSKKELKLSKTKNYRKKSARGARRCAPPLRRPRKYDKKQMRELN